MKTCYEVIIRYLYEFFILPTFCHYMYVLEVKEKFIAKLNKHVGLNYILRFLKFNYLVLL